MYFFAHFIPEMFLFIHEMFLFILEMFLFILEMFLFILECSFLYLNVPFLNVPFLTNISFSSACLLVNYPAPRSTLAQSATPMIGPPSPPTFPSKTSLPSLSSAASFHRLPSFPLAQPTKSTAFARESHPNP